jgi:hypothetical protein
MMDRTSRRDVRLCARSALHMAPGPSQDVKTPASGLLERKFGASSVFAPGVRVIQWV